jgi:hypothetical protein
MPGAEQPASEGTTASPHEEQQASHAEGEPESDRATDAELLALAEEVARLERALGAAQRDAKSGAEAAETAREETAEWREREADARAEVLVPPYCLP